MKKLLLAVVAIVVSPFLFAQASITSSVTFTPADGARTWMDIGGAWDGSADVSATTGDSFVLSLDNTAVDSAFDLTTTFTLPPELNLVGTGSAAVVGAGCGAAPTVSLAQVGTTVTATYTPAGYDLPGNCELQITMGAVSTINMPVGNTSVAANYQSATVDLGTLGAIQTRTASFETRGGELLASKDDIDIEAAVGEDATVDIEACNLGDGGLFDVIIDESAVNPNPANSLQVQSLTQSTPAAPASVLNFPARTIPYLAPGECFKVRTVSEVTSCSEIDHTSNVSHRVVTTPQEIFSSVALDLTTPLVSFGSIGSSFINTINVPGSGANTINIPIFNVGIGIAKGLKVNLPLPAGVNITNVDANWTYAAGEFTYVGGDVMGMNTMINLAFDVSRALVCPLEGGSSSFTTGQASYTDGCGNAYSLPVNIASVVIAGATAPFELSKSVASMEMNPGDSSSYTLTVTRGDAANLTSDPLVISDVLTATNIDAYTVGAAPAGTSFLCGGDAICTPGETLEWSIPQATLAANPSLALTVNFDVSTDECVAGTSVTNTATTNYTITSAMCAAAQDSSTIFYIQSDDTEVGSANSSLGLVGAPVIGGSYETGTADDADGIRQAADGEGEFISFNRTLDFSAGGVGTWTGSTHSDDFGGLAGQTLVPGSARVELNDSGVDISIPGGSILTSTGSLSISLDFLAGGGFFGVDSVVGQKLEIKYEVTTNDIDLLGNLGRSVVTLSVTSIAGGAGAGATGCVVGGGLAPKEYRDFSFYTIARRSLVGSVTIPQIVEICGETPIVMNVRDGDGLDYGYHPIITMINGGYGFDTGQTVNYGGTYTAGNITENLLATNSTFELGPETFEQLADSTIGFNVVLPALSSTTPQDFCVGVQLDDTQGLATGGKNITNASQCSRPVNVVAGDLSFLISPDNIQILGDQTEFTISVVNGGAGTAYNVIVNDTIPAGLVPNKVETDLRNAAGPDNNVTVAGQLMTWDIGDIAPGTSKSIRVVVDVSGATCAPLNGLNDIEATWGCGGTTHQTVNSTLPNFRFNAASVDVLHRSTSEVQLCDDGSSSQAEILVKNTSNTTIYSLLVDEILDSATTGISLGAVPNFEYSLDNGGSFSPLAAPTGAGTTATPYVFDMGAVLDPMGGFAPLQTVIIRFTISANELANNNPAVSASAGGNISCGDSASSSSTNFTFNTIKPNIRVVKRGRNITTAGTFSDTTYGAQGDIIEWEVQVQNTGATSAEFMELTENLVNTSGSPTGSLNGPGHAGTVITDNVFVGINDTNTSSTNTYTIQETLGNTCLNDNNIASVTWACSAASPNKLTTPTDNTDTSGLVMNGAPTITQSWAADSNGKGEIVIDITNTGAYIENFSLTVEVLNGFELDTSDLETATKNLGVIAINRAGSATVPVYTFPGTFLRNGDDLQVRIPVVPTTFDTASDLLTNPETVANTFDSPLPASSNNRAIFDFDNSCGTTDSVTQNTVLDPISPDLDISITPANRIVSDAEVVTFTITVTNNGDAGSIASDFDVASSLGAGWTPTNINILTPGVGGGGGNCNLGDICTAAQLGSLAQGASAVIEIQATVTTGGPLTVETEVTGEVIDNGAGVLGNYSFDRAKSRVIGVVQTKTLQSTSETFTAGTNLAIGEDAVYRLRFEIFGVEASEPISGVTVRETLPVGIGYASHVPTGAHTMGAITASPTAFQTGAVDFTIPGNLTTDSVFEIDLTVRALNDDANNTDGKNLTMNLGSSFVYQAQTFSSDDAADSFGGDQPLLHDDLPLTIARPVLTIAKVVRNISGGAFAATAQGDAGDIVEYEVTIENNGSAPAFDLSLADTADTKLVVINGSADTVDNDGDTNVDGGDLEGTYGANTVSFNHADTILPTAGQNMLQLDNGETLTFLYRATIDSSSTPADNLLNDAQIDWTTLPGANGSQTVPLGTPDDPEGEAIQDLSAQATVEVADVSFSKQLVPVVTSLAIGETANFRLEFVLPSGTVPALQARDILPEGFSLESVTINAGAETNCATQIATPAAYPASGSGGDLNFSVNFGTCVVTNGASAADRTIQIDYVVKARNIATNINTAALDNTADYIFTGFDGPDSTVSVTVVEPIIALTKSALTATTGLDAGDTVQFSVVFNNTGTSTAHDLNVVDNLPVGMLLQAIDSVVLGGGAATDTAVSGIGTTTLSGEFTVPVGGSVQITYTVVLGDSVEADQVLTNDVDINYSSLDGVDVNERTGVDGDPLNTYLATDSVDSTIKNVFSSNKTITSADTVAGGGYRVGDIIEYRLDVTFQEGTTRNAQFRDILPTGLEFDSFDPPTPASGAQWTYTLATNPSSGDSGNIAWDFGTVINSASGGADILSLTYRVKVVDTGGVATTPTTFNLPNQFNFHYVDALSNPESTPDTVVDVDIKQPELMIAKALQPAQLTDVVAGDTVDYVITITNTGDAPAYNAVVKDVLPIGLRQTAPITQATTTLNGIVTAVANPVYTPATGEALWGLTDAQVIEPGQSLVLNYRVEVDADAGAGLSFVNSANIENYYSQPSTPANPDRRSYGATPPVSAPAVMTPSPTDALKAVSGTDFQIGDEFDYTITVPQTPVNAKLYDVVITDGIAANLEVISVTTNAGAIAETVVDSTAGNNVSVAFDELDPNEQAIVTVKVRVLNTVANQNGVPVNNTAGFVWASTDGGTAQPSISTNTVGVNIIEPVVSIDKQRTGGVLANTTLGFQAADTVVFTISVTNTGPGIAHQVEIIDLIDEKLISPSVTANPDNPGAPTVGATVANKTEYTWNIGTLGVGITYTFDVEFTLDATVQPLEFLVNEASTSFKSTAVDNPQTRDGSDPSGVDDYLVGPVTAQLAVAGIQFDKKLPTPIVTKYSVGESVFFDLEVELITGQILDLRVEDILPVGAGLEYVAHNIVVTNAQRLGGGAITLGPPVPTAGDTGTLNFDLGDVEGTVSGAKIVIELETRVRDIVTNVNATTLTNNAQAIFDDPNNPGTDATLVDPTPVTIEIQDPLIFLALDGPSDIDLTETEGLVVRLNNLSEKPAYQPTIQVLYPVGMRDTDPTTGTESVVISGGRSLTLTKGVDYTTVYNAGTGVYEIELISAQAFLDVSETITINFETELDNDAAGGQNLEFDAVVTNFFSINNVPVPGVNRAFTGSLGNGSVGTANGVVGDDGRDNVVMLSNAPALSIIKSVDQVAIGTGEVLTYQVTLTNTGTADANITTLTDDLGSFFKAGTLNVSNITPACGVPCNLTVNGAGGVNAKGSWLITDLTVPAAGGIVTITFDAELEDVIPSGTVIANQATAVVDGLTAPVLSDSNSAADDNGTEEGNNGADPNDDDPVLTVIESQPDLQVLKSSDHAGKTGPVSEGDTLTYTIAVNNNGTENTNSSTLVDTIPAFTTYVANSTTLNGSPVADIGGSSPLVSGMPINTVGSSAGILTVGQSATVTFQVLIDTGLSPSAVITNQAQLNTTGDGSGPKPIIYSDNPETGADGDPTMDFLSSAPSITAEKSVLDVNAGTLAIGDEVEYQIIIRNSGFTDQTNATFTDTIATQLTYVPGTLQVDIDGPSSAGGFALLTDAADADNGDVTGANVTVAMATIAAESAYTIKFRATVNGGTADGTLINNQGTVSASGLPDVLTDSDGNTGNGDQPTSIIVGSVASLRMIKAVADVNGGTVEAGDELLYTITTQNIGSIDATNVIVTDPVAPAGTAYVVNTTIANNVVVPDNVGASALVAGHNIGTIVAGGSSTVTYKVVIDDPIADGTTISNQATYAADGGLSGVSDSDLNDGVENGNDATNPNDDDPTLLSVGGASGSAILQGSVWLDTNSDNVFDGNEVGLTGWVVEILQGGVVISTTTTGPTGTYSFNGLPAGSGYQVQFKHPETGTVYGGVDSSAPGVDTTDGTIRSLTLYNGLNLLEQNLPVDPSGVVYDSIARTPVAGVAVSIEGPPGFDAATMTLAGQFGQVTGSDGRYRYDLIPTAPAGTYTLTFVNPGSYLPGVSQIITPTAGPFNGTGLPDPQSIGSGPLAPQAGDSTVYYLTFEINPADPTYPNIINNHIPIDPILDGAIAISKTTPLVNVSKGEMVPYTIIASNRIAASISNIDVTDQMPPGFSFMDGSATVDGLAITPTKNGRTLNFANLTFANGESKTIKLLLRVGLGVSEGEYVNAAYALNNVVGAQVSNTATATVRVVPDAIFDCPEIIGKVFDDTNRDGYFDEGEVGVPGVEVTTARGWIITTDEFGRYHVACPAIPNDAIGSNFILKVNPRTLPTGYRVTSHNPKLTRLTRAKVNKVNFAVSIDKVIHVEVHGALDFDQVKDLVSKMDDQRTTLRMSFHNQDKDRKLIKDFEREFKDKNVNFEYEWINKGKTKTTNTFINDETRCRVSDANDIVEEKPVVVVKPTKVIQDSINRQADKSYVINFSTLSSENIEIDGIVSGIINLHKQQGIERIHVVGHTDSDRIIPRPTNKYQNNVELSKARASLVADKLMANDLGIQISFDGKGFSEPIASNKTRAGKAQNRRTEIKLYYSMQKQVTKPAIANVNKLQSGCNNNKFIVKGLEDNQKSSFELDPILGTNKSVKKKNEVIADSISKKADNTIVVNFASLSSKNLVIDDVITQIVKLQKARGVQRIHVVGHTDSDLITGRAKKKYADNVELSKARAYAVAAKLLESDLGIQISFDGKGFSEPVATNDTRAGKARNRRTEVKLYYKTRQKAKDEVIGSFTCQTKVATGETVSIDGNKKLERQDQQRCMDVALEKASLQVRHNPLNKTKRLNVRQIGENQFEFYTNYHSYIKKAELVIRENGSYKAKEVTHTIPSLKGIARLETTLTENSTYALRVYDKYGNYDETFEKKIYGNDRYPEQSIWGESTLDVSGIAINPGAISVNGEGIPANYEVFIMGEQIPVDKKGKFVVEQHFEDDAEYGIEVLVVDENGTGIEYRRDIYVPKQDWFGVGIIDITVGQNNVNGAAVEVTQDDHHYDEKLYVDGRIAGYVKGKYRGKYLVTGMIDTRESEIDQLFNNFLAKDPISIFRRIDPQEYYPVYGDDSQFQEDAPTQGKLYLKVERDENYFLWGNFRTKLTETEFSRYDRAFYGANVHYESKKQVAGEKASNLDVFAAAPETLMERDEFRGTGGSFYWLRRRDIVRGSERARVEVRDINSNIVLSSRTLVAETDYTVNYINGQVLLSNPLESYGDQATLVRNGSGSGNAVFLVVNYEYIPGFQDLDALAIGGRFSQWLGKKLKLGVSAVDQEQFGQEFKQYGADATYKLGKSGHIKLEWAQTDGLGNQEASTIDGGFLFTDQRVQQARKANAYFAELALDLYSTAAGQGKLSAYFRKREEGFAAVGQQANFETDQYGAEANLPLGKKFVLLTKYDVEEQVNFVERKTLDTRLDYLISESWKASLGYRSEDREVANTGAGAGVLSQAIGDREDAIAQLSHKINEDFSWYVFGQKTLSTSATRIENDRYGLGVDLRFKQRYTAGVELSDGTGGLGTRLKAGYQLDEQTEAYISYLLENNNNDTLLTPLAGNRGNLVTGVKRRYDETSSIYYENKFEHGRNRPEGLTHSFGVELTPYDKWTVALGFETGRLRDANNSIEIERRAGSIGIAKSNKKDKIALNVEYREDKQQSQDRETLLVKARYDRQLNESWKVLIRGNFSNSQSSQGEFFDGDYTEAALAFAYRPIDNDRLNMLFRYSFTEILPSVGQLTNNGAIPDFRQRTQQLSMDMVYDLNKYMAVGFKYGFALRELQNSRLGGRWFNSNAHIAALRLDVHIVKKWDLMLEGRRLWFEGDEQARMGAVIGIFRYMDKNQNLRLGVGYSFADFSDDLTQLDYDFDGWFINMTGAF